MCWSPLRSFLQSAFGQNLGGGGPADMTQEASTAASGVATSVSASSTTAAGSADSTTRRPAPVPAQVPPGFSFGRPQTVTATSHAGSQQAASAATQQPAAISNTGQSPAPDFHFDPPTSTRQAGNVQVDALPMAGGIANQPDQFTQ